MANEELEGNTLTVYSYIVHVSIILLSLVIKDLVIQVSFIFLTGMTRVAMILFLIEGLVLYRKINPKHADRGESIG